MVQFFMTQCRRTKWILGNVQNNYRNMTDYVNRQVHAVGPATEKARRPKVRRWRGTERRWRLAERRRCRPSLSENDMQCSFKYWGALSCIHWRTVMQSLNCTRSGTSSQWRSVCNRRDRPRSNFFVLLTRRAATLSTRCSLFVVYFGAPASTVLQ